ncbi:wall-associated receptor kinase-like 8 [Henckelia pumila]|uniref:wall-associated receptor kinase-like 8 n=1 Tax=Henckelia pumila TaxID=405737 RepID=UPI003C6E5089
MGFPNLILGIMVTMLLMLFITTTLAVSMVKPGCPEMCGNISIPYPFGIGPSCSASSSFTITCKSSNSVPILSSIHFDFEVLHISLEEGWIYVKQPLSPLNCSPTEETRSVQGLTLLGTPYTINGRYNSLVVLGCQNDVWLPANEMTSTLDVCTDICDRNSPDYSFNGVCKALCLHFHSTDKTCNSTYSSCNDVCSAFCDHFHSPRVYCYPSSSYMSCQNLCGSICDGIYSSTTDKSCYSNGTSCIINGGCRISIAAGLQQLEFSYRTHVDSSSSNISCGYVFLADQQWFEEVSYKGFQSNFSNPFDELRYSILLLDWVLDQHNNLSHYASPECFYSGVPSGYSSPSPCTCDHGFEGNPYLSDGCHDIDECGTPLVYCDGHCINTLGSFTCHQKSNLSNHHLVKTITTILASVVGTLILLYVGWKYSKVLGKIIKEKRRVMFFKRNGGLLLEQHLSATGYGVEKIRLFGSKELARATDRYNENRVLGRGGQGTVYKGMLIDGRIVAVKKSKRINQCDIETFINEVVILAHINHRNIVKLLGCCLETEIPLLVYEFIPNGTLFQHIHNPNDEFPITWEMRVRIATEVANSLSYLHSAASAPIYHRDIKSSNILLDEKYRAKLSDFGTSRSVAIDQTHLTTRVLGTFGYMDPEYFRSSHFTEKSDVYSFGVVLVELLTGEKAVSTVRAEEAQSLAIHFLQSMEEDNLLDILDPLVLKEGPKEEILTIARLARRCLYLNGKKRPTMKEVAVELEGIRMSKQGPTDLQHDDEEDEAFQCSYELDNITSTASSVDSHPYIIDEP